LGVLHFGNDAVQARMAWSERARLRAFAGGGVAGPVGLPFRLVAGEVGGAGPLDASRGDHLTLDGNRDGSARHELAAGIDHQVLDAGGLALLEGPALTVQSDKAIAAPELRGAAVGHILAALIADGALDLESGAPQVRIGQVELGRELSLVA